MKKIICIICIIFALSFECINASSYKENSCYYNGINCCSAIGRTLCDNGMSDSTCKCEDVNHVTSTSVSDYSNNSEFGNIYSYILLIIVGLFIYSKVK